MEECEESREACLQSSYQANYDAALLGLYKRRVTENRFVSWLCEYNSSYLLIGLFIFPFSFIKRLILDHHEHDTKLYYGVSI